MSNHPNIDVPMGNCFVLSVNDNRVALVKHRNDAEVMRDLLMARYAHLITEGKVQVYMQLAYQPDLIIG